MIKGYFGIPGCGKSTLLTKIGTIELNKLKKRYRNIYTINIDIEGCTRITKEDCRKYRYEKDLILWDEITLDYDNRDFKSFTKEDKDFWILHRHMGTDIIYVTQNYENVDKKIRDLTQELWYMSKSVIPLLKEFTVSKRIYRQININEYTSELTMGYRFCNLLESFFVKNMEIVYRKKYYKYFDSFDLIDLGKRELIPYNNPKIEKGIIKYLNKIERKFKWRK